ncbi:hypothetical protein TNCV_2756521 [Trichonephila clavipes]|nr:hypothetical protein TNCV_2756521 [Trichonephila clavipes]
MHQKHLTLVSSIRCKEIEKLLKLRFWVQKAKSLLSSPYLSQFKGNSKGIPRTPFSSLRDATCGKHAGRVRIYHPRKRNKGVVDTEGLDGEGSRAKQVEILDYNRFRAQVESEDGKGLAREESTNVEQLRGKRMRSEGSGTDLSPKKRNKGVVDTEGLDGEGSRAKQVEILDYNRFRAQVESEDGKGLAREESTNVEQLRVPVHLEERQITTDVLPGWSSPYQLRSRRHINERKELSRRSNPYPPRNKLLISERQEPTGRTSPYLTRA